MIYGNVWVSGRRFRPGLTIRMPPCTCVQIVGAALRTPTRHVQSAVTNSTPIRHRRSWSTIGNSCERSSVRGGARRARALVAVLSSINVSTGPGMRAHPIVDVAHISPHAADADSRLDCASSPALLALQSAAPRRTCLFVSTRGRSEERHLHRRLRESGQQRLYTRHYRA